MDYDEWLEANEDELWIKYHETGAYYDSDYEEWLENEHDRFIEKNNHL